MVKKVRVKVRKPSQQRQYVNNHYNIVSGVKNLKDLQDVDTTGLANGKVLKYDEASGKWKPGYVSGGSGGGASTFTDLTDTPNNYTGQANKTVKVKPDESGLYFSEITSEDIIDFNDAVSNHPDVSANTNTRHVHDNKDVLDAIINTGDGTKFLADDGTYKSISTLSGAKVLVYTNGDTYTTNQLIVDSGYANLYIALKDFTATDLTSDLNNGNIKVISSSISGGGYKQYVYSTETSGDTVTITLINPNKNYSRHVFVLKKEIISSIDIIPYNFNGNNDVLYNPKYIVEDGAIYLKQIYKYDTVYKNELYYESDIIDLTEYKDIISIDVIFN